MTRIEISSSLNEQDKRSLERFFDRAYDSNDYAFFARRADESRARGRLYEILVKDDSIDGMYDPLSEAHKLARRAMIAIGRTFDYRIERQAAAARMMLPATGTY